VSPEELPSLREELPKLRGILHRYAFFCAIAAAAVLVARAGDAEARTAALIYGAGLCALFGASSLYHRWPGDPRFKPVLRRIDHSVIFVFIAASYTPVAMLLLDPPLGAVVLASVWSGALAGVGLSVIWIEAPRWLSAAAYVAVGWVIVIALPALVDEAGVAATVLFLAGGVLYTAGAAVYAARKPDPWPRVYGFHEVFHTLVILAAVTHFVAMAGWVVR
jgi:hemolysin III